jgi:hypothetical protein
MKDVVGIAKPNTGVKNFLVNGWEYCGAARTISYYTFILKEDRRGGTIKAGLLTIDMIH